MRGNDKAPNRHPESKNPGHLVRQTGVSDSHMTGFRALKAYSGMISLTMNLSPSKRFSALVSRFHWPVKCTPPLVV